MIHHFPGLKLIQSGAPHYPWVFSFCLTLALGYLFLRMAPKVGFTDNPEGSYRKIHKYPKALGGPVILLGFLPVYFLNTEQALPLTVSLILVFATGVFDDLWEVSPKLKLLLHLGAAAILVLLIQIPTTVLGFTENLSVRVTGPVNLLLIIFWLAGGTNAINLIDGLDGLATGLGIITMVFLLLVSTNPPAYLVIGLALATLAGFILYNFYPANLFLGDGGSYFIGFLLSYCIIMGLSEQTPASELEWRLLPGLLLMGIPVFDTAWAIVRRARSKKGIMQADNSHLHHRLYYRFNHLTAVADIYVLQVILNVLVIAFFF